ncbi:MAG: DUF58 domain-containing protein [Gammaproteobacteria bacterium]
MSSSIILDKAPVSTGDAVGRGGSTRKRLYIFPTQHGLVYACMLPVMLLGAVNYTNNMAYMLTFLLGSLFMVCMLHTYRNLRGLIVASNDARSVFAGETAQFPLLFDNRAGPLRNGVCVDPWPKGWKFRKSRRTGVENIRLEPGQIQRDSLPIRTRTRGYLNPGRLRIHSSWPLGLFRAWSYLECKSTCIVYPKPQGDPALPYLTEDSSLDQSGDQPGTDDFTGFRHYRPGDSIRNIDWKVLAREQGLLVKKFSGSGARQLILHWDQTAHLGDTETRLSQLALWLLKAEQGGYRYGLTIPGAKIDIDNGEAHQHRCLRTLATYAVGDTD